ncbi:nibrin [Protopterus annectens]|uniref:nibrin n=1 Tax=Protopterus annectens TaxID=7888 RepID=UPI001CFACD0F|nr:nibrin [Protopterus annectens]
MWKLIPFDATGETIRLLAGVEYDIGRKNCSVILQDDPSISRTHAVLSVSHSTANLGHVSSLPVLTVKDKSKYGTFVDKVRLQTEVPKTLNAGDIVTFGVYNSKFRVEYEPLVLCSSCLDGPGKTALSQTVQQLGGHIVNNWTDSCTHLVMTTLKVAIKTICAFISARPILKPDYFTELLRAIQAKKQLPSCESFLPPLDEPSLNPEDVDTSVRPERKTIFRGKTFLFMNAKQFKKLSPAIILGGGEAKLLDEGSKDTSLLETACVVEVGCTNSQLSVSETTKKWTESIMAALQRKALRAISEAEIGLAVICMSTDVYCNPRSPTADIGAASKTIPGPTLSQSTAVEETVMPGPTLNVTAYVPNTESSQIVDPRLEISGVGAVKDTPEKEQTSKAALQDVPAVKEVTSTRGPMNTAVPLFSLEDDVKNDSQRNCTGLQRKSAGHFSGRESTMSGRSKERASQQQSNLLSNYFQPINKKRGRDLETDVSQTKFARLEQQRPSSPNQINSSSLFAQKTEESQIFSSSDPFTRSIKNKGSAVQSCEVSDLSNAKNLVSDNTIKKNNFTDIKIAQTKRKEVDDLFYDDDLLQQEFSSELHETNVNPSNQSQGDGLNANKKRKLEPKSVKEEKSYDFTEMKSTKSSDNEVKEKVPVRTKAEQELSKFVKKEEADTNGVLLDDEYNNLPNKLVQVKFASLIVGCPKPAKTSSNPDSGEKKNFKKFKKVAFPGASDLPQIIGGSDLEPHQTKKNSELEAWLRQELREQDQHAREESLADDLFRYDPKMAKRRR